MMVGAGCTNAVIGLVLFTISVATHTDATMTLERICIRGNVRTRDKVIRREIRVPFEVADIQNAKRRLEALGFFDKVDITTRAGSSRGLVVLDIEVNEKPNTQRAGFSSTENFIAEVRMCQNCSTVVKTSQVPPSSE